jgi:muramoyltetrapeptide carboxypeptidase LdcA involved in peptidoglycan recycling
MPHARENAGWVSASARERAADLHQAFADPEIRAVLAAIGGNHCNQLLVHLDFDLIAANPKIFQGYSDITVLHWAFMKRSRLRTFYGPSLSLELAEYPSVLPYTDRSLRAAWFEAQPARFEPPDTWTDEFIEYSDGSDLVRPRKLRPNQGWLSLRDGEATGPLLGGCLQTISSQLKGSDLWLDLSGAILFLEASDDCGTPSHVDAYLTDLELLGVFHEVKALIVGRPIRYTPEETEAFWRVVVDHTEDAGIPVLANVDCGHADPMLSLPLGAMVRLVAETGHFEVLESPTQ